MTKNARKLAAVVIEKMHESCRPLWMRENARKLAASFGETCTEIGCFWLKCMHIKEYEMYRILF